MLQHKNSGKNKLKNHYLLAETIAQESTVLS